MPLAADMLNTLINFSVAYISTERIKNLYLYLRKNNIYAIIPIIIESFNFTDGAFMYSICYIVYIIYNVTNMHIIIFYV